LPNPADSCAQYGQQQLQLGPRPGGRRVWERRAWGGGRGEGRAAGIHAAKYWLRM